MTVFFGLRVVCPKQMCKHWLDRKFNIFFPVLDPLLKRPSVLNRLTFLFSISCCLVNIVLRSIWYVSPWDLCLQPAAVSMESFLSLSTWTILCVLKAFFCISISYGMKYEIKYEKRTSRNGLNPLNLFVWWPQIKIKYMLGCHKTQIQ